MSRSETPWDLGDRSVDRADVADREVRITDFALLAMLPLRTLEPTGLPLNELATAALVVLCLFRPARGGAALAALPALLLASLVALLTWSGVANDVEWTRRVGHVVIVGGLVWSLGTGRVSLRSAALGLATGLVAVIALALVGIGGDTYAGRLTGFLGDPNAGAYFIVVLGTLAVLHSDDRTRIRVAVAIPLVTGLVLTYSRTGLLAGALVVVWLLVARRLTTVRSTALACGLVWLASRIPDDLTTIGPFSDRTGSDKLRDRIIAQERVRLADMPWYGNGPGSATVEIRDLEFFFHNSYLATRQEGGWGALLLVLALLAYAFLRLSHQSREGDLAAAAAQAAIIATAVMAITLGEVLLDTPMAIVVGFALGHATAHKSAAAPDG